MMKRVRKPSKSRSGAVMVSAKVAPGYYVIDEAPPSADHKNRGREVPSLLWVVKDETEINIGPGVDYRPAHSLAWLARHGWCYGFTVCVGGSWIDMAWIVAFEREHGGPCRYASSRVAFKSNEGQAVPIVRVTRRGKVVGYIAPLARIDA